MGDMRQAFRDAHVRQWEAFRRSGRLTEAAQVAELLRSEYGHEVDGADAAVATGRSTGPHITFETEEDERAFWATEPDKDSDES